MTARAIESDFRRAVSESVQLMAEGPDRFQVFTPFRFDDGDHLAVILEKRNGHWVLTDEAHTFLHLGHDLDERDLQTGTRQKIIAGVLTRFQVEDRDGELVLEIRDGRYGDALYSFVQALLHMTDISYLSRERVLSTFLEDFRAFLTQVVPEDRRQFDWSHPEHDPGAMYAVDCRIDGRTRPLFVHALPSDGRTRDATIALLQFERWNIPFRSLAIFEDQESINRKVLARFSDVCEKQFSTLAGNHERIHRFLEANGLPVREAAGG